MKNKTDREIVLESYPDAVAINVGTKRHGKYFHIISNLQGYLGKGKSKKNAWKAASNNLNTR